jgi:hypothetical protein
MSSITAIASTSTCNVGTTNPDTPIKVEAGGGFSAGK